MSRTSALPVRSLSAAVLLFLVVCPASPSQRSSAPPASEDAAKKEKSPELPAQIELLETHIRFEANGDSRKEVHTLVRINNQLGARQFARLNFDYNRAFEQVDLPLVRVTHASGGTADILPSAITDNPNPAVINTPAYQDVRVKSVRILGLAEGDHLEYQVITTTTHPPLAPDFWLDHTFDRTGVVSVEVFELDFPTARNPEIRINPAFPAANVEKAGEADAAHTAYHWRRTQTNAPAESQSPDKSTDADPDIVLSTTGWRWLSVRLDERLTPGARPIEKPGSNEESMQELSKRQVSPEVAAKAAELTKGARSSTEKLQVIYDFVSQKIATVDLPLGATGFASRPADQILSSACGNPEDKFVLFAALAAAENLSAEAALTGYSDPKGLARPSVFKHLLISASDGKSRFWLDPSLEVAPFGVISPSSGKNAFVLNRLFLAMNSTGQEWQPLEASTPFPAAQKVSVNATLAADGALTAKVKYTMRGDNELLLRVAFHQTPREKWNEVAQLLSLSDGFRGKITKVTASDPYATKVPFTLEYEITQAKFVDWTKTPIRVPAILPLVGLPDPPAKPGAASAAIDLGTPLDVQATVTLQLPAGTVAHPPIGTSVSRDYATFSSQYATRANTVTASRRINFLLREIPAARAPDYNAFLRAVQNDEAQSFTLDPPTGTQLRHPTSAETNSSAPSRPKP